MQWLWAPLFGVKYVLAVFGFCLRSCCDCFPEEICTGALGGGLELQAVVGQHVRLDFLDETKAALRVLLFVSRHEGTNITEIIRSMRVGQKAIYTALKTLNDLNLIEERTGSKFPYPRLFHLTKKGRQVAEHLVKTEEVLSGT